MSGPERAPLRVTAGGDARSIEDIDLLIFAVGYETRSRFAAEELEGRFRTGLGIRFGEHEDLAFTENAEWAAANQNVAVVEAPTRFDVARFVNETLDSLPEVQGRELHIGFDVSSFPRVNLAAIYTALTDFAVRAGGIRVDFIYSFAKFTVPPDEHGPVIEFGAVSPEFAGIGEAELGLATVIGLGYESELALSAQQVLDPALTWLAVPRSPDAQFDRALTSSNDLLLNLVDPRNIWTYRADDPYSTFVELEAIVHGLDSSHNVVVVPLGPKLFVVVCLLVSSLYHNLVGVWRLSPGGLRIPREQFPTGQISYLTAHFRG